MKIIAYDFYQNIKNNTIYSIVELVTNSTNANDGEQMVLYKDVNTNKMYVREIEEFKTKFKKYEV